MLYYSSCRKCLTGTVQLSERLDGRELKCINCGFQYIGYIGLVGMAVEKAA